MTLNSYFRKLAQILVEISRSKLSFPSENRVVIIYHPDCELHCGIPKWPRVATLL
jgi:hypothetical protein